MKRQSTYDGASSSSSANPRGFVHDVFLSFRGSDTRRGFTDYLYSSLVRAGIRAFRDNEELRVGEEIGDNLLEAISQSKIFIPIFSKGYASSKWCLKEAAHMLKCKNSGNHLVLPVFYDVTPHQVRHQYGTYEESFEWHSENLDEETVQEWRNALKEIGTLKGWDVQNDAHGHEGEVVQSIVQQVYCRLRRKQLHVADFPVMLEHHVDLIASEVAKEPMVGLCGIGGMGKTTIAKAVFNRMLYLFDGVCFLANVRENSRMSGLVRLQEILLCDVLEGANFRINYVDEGINIIRDRLGQKNILVVVDDVDDSDQLMKLVGDYSWFGPESRIIITTRDEHLLISHGVKFRYKVSGLDKKYALELFVLYAFRIPALVKSLKAPFIGW